MSLKINKIPFDSLSLTPIYTLFVIHTHTHINIRNTDAVPVLKYWKAKQLTGYFCMLMIINNQSFKENRQHILRVREIEKEIDKERERKR